jgi:polyketide cyclase/dehydrase/lipid transport protein
VVTASTISERYTSPPDAAWQLVGDFAGIGEVFDGVDDVVVVDDLRTFNLMGMRITERLISRDESTRTITYSIIDGVPVDAHESSIRVHPHESGCEIVWSVTSDPEAAQPLFADAYRGALIALHTKLDVA